jgi:hypothetical protein
MFIYNLYLLFIIFLYRKYTRTIMNIDYQIERQINSYYTYTKLKYHTHLQAAIYYKSWYHYTTTPLIIISSIVTVLASYNGSYNDQIMAITVAVLSGITTIMHAAKSFFEFDSKSTVSLGISNKYINLARYIENNFYTNYITNDDKISADSMRIIFNFIQTELANIQSTEPTLPVHIQNTDYSQASYGIGKISDGLIDICMNPIISNPMISNPTNTGNRMSNIDNVIRMPQPIVKS